MGLMDFIKGELIEIIEWTDDSRDTLSYRFPDDDKTPCTRATWRDGRWSGERCDREDRGRAPLKLDQDRPPDPGRSCHNVFCREL